MPETSSPAPLLANLVHFGRVLRAVGLDVSHDRLVTLSRALALVELGDRREVKDTCRSVLVTRHEQTELFDRAFEAFFRPERGGVGIDLGELVRRGAERRRRAVALMETAAAEGGDAGLPELPEPWVERRFTWSDRELLRRKDFAELTPEEAAAVRRWMREEVLAVPPRRTRRREAARSGPYPDLRRALRGALRSFGGGSPELPYRRRRSKSRPLVVLADISGSMEPYSRLLLQFVWTLAASSDRLEAFVFGTRLTRITRPLLRRSVDQALSEAAALVRDWGGGTRIGEALKRFNYRWGRRVLGRGAVVVVISDGWDRGDADLLEREVARLHRSADRLLWLNPLLGSPGYEPLTRGIRAVLPHVDDFLPVHNLKSLGDLAQVLRRLGAPPARPRRSPANLDEPGEPDDSGKKGALRHA